MARIFLPLEAKPGIIRITGEKARYLATVLRTRPGDDLEILDGKGHAYAAKVASLSKKEIVAEVKGMAAHDTESPLSLALLQGLLKGEKMEIVIQKATELGVGEIVPAITERSQVRETRKTSRWEKVAEDAARQCGRTTIPRIHKPLPFPDIFFGPALPFFHESKGLLFWEEGGLPLKAVRKRLGEDCRNLVLAVGPEGGFTREEVALAESRGFLTASLGSRILRAETAAITAIALMQFLLGDIG
ncbi:MAG: 16S rRNA (uracil(1498)-N(3))-methyltransferase [Nitrospirae bacterium]|nr:16S rRNA (uracil(1498)-N(3))-methyltransferase [Nitrospirota bacterium]